MGGVEWLVDAHGCDPERLRDRVSLQSLFDAVVAGLDLHPIGDAAWHQFPVTRGLTGLWMLKESHLAIHTFPEHASACINLFCCRPRPEWPWEERLTALLGATLVEVRSIERSYAPAARSRP